MEFNKEEQVKLREVITLPKTEMIAHLQLTLNQLIADGGNIRDGIQFLRHLVETDPSVWDVIFANYYIHTDIVMHMDNKTLEAMCAEKFGALEEDEHAY